MTLFFSLTVALPTEQPRDFFPDKPKEDPFYNPPAGFESEAPGTILRQRPIVASFFGFLPDPIEAHQLLYRTTAIDGSAIATVTTIFKPWFPQEDRFVSFQTAYDSSAPKCNPSYNYQLGASSTDLISSAEFLIIQAYLLKGYIVSSPDYEGPDAAFSPGHLEGMGVLDSMRAVANFKDTLGLSDNPMAVGVGYSGGAIATGWAASLQPLYASELNVKGWVQGGTPANLTGTLLKIDDTLFSGFAPVALAGLLKPSAYGAKLGPFVDSIVTPQGRDVLDYANTHCTVADLLNFFDKSIFSPKFQSMGRDVLYDPTLSSILAQTVMGAKQPETPTAPVFIYHAKQDEIVPYYDIPPLVDSWCGYGADVKFTTFGNGGHITTEVIALPEAVNFVDAAFAGNAVSGCTRNSELTSLLNPFALGVELEPILIQLVGVLIAAGEQDENIKQDLGVFGKSVG